MTRKVFFVSVLSGLVASVAFVWLLDPVTRWIWHTASLSASSWFVHLQNAAFKNAALGKREWLSTALFIYLFLLWVATLISAPIGIATGLGLRGFLRRTRAGRVEHVVRHRVMPKALVVSLVGMALLLTYSLGRLAFLAYVDLQLNASFSQRLDVLAPYVDTLEERRLRSEWALMKTRTDYDRINEHLDQLAAAAKVSLPEPLLK